MPLTMNPALNQQMAQLEREYEQRKANIMQSFYNQPQSGSWGQQSAPAPTQNVDWIRVSGIDGAKNQIVQPGQTVWMMDNNEPYFYVKSADNVGSIPGTVTAGTWRITAGSVAGIPVTVITAGRGTTPTIMIMAIPIDGAEAQPLADMYTARTIPACLGTIPTWTSTGTAKESIPTAGTKVARDVCLMH